MSVYHYVRQFFTSAVHTAYQPVRSLLLRPLNSHCDQVHHVMMQREYSAKSPNRNVHTGLQFYQPVCRRLRCMTHLLAACSLHVARCTTDAWILRIRYETMSSGPEGLHPVRNFMGFTTTQPSCSHALQGMLVINVCNADASRPPTSRKRSQTFSKPVFLLQGLPVVNVCDADVEKFCVKDAEKLKREWAAGKGPGGVSKHGILGRAAADASVGEVCGIAHQTLCPCSVLFWCPAVLPCIARQVMQEASCNMSRTCLGHSGVIQTGRCREGCCVGNTESGLHLWLANPFVSWCAGATVSGRARAAGAQQWRPGRDASGGGQSYGAGMLLFL